MLSLTLNPLTEALPMPLSNLLAEWGIGNRFDFAWLLRNALNDDRLIKVEYTQGTRYTTDIVDFTLTQAKPREGSA